MSDLFGSIEPSAPFKDIRNTRPSNAEDKAELSYRLGMLCMKVPTNVRNGSINQVRAWQAARLAARLAALRVVKNKRASISELNAAISNMGRLQG